MWMSVPSLSSLLLCVAAEGRGAGCEMVRQGGLGSFHSLVMQ